MRKVTDGNGNDSTAATLLQLKTNRQPRLPTLYLIGDPDDPNAIWLTDWEAPLIWSLWGTFKPSTITRGTVTSQFGLKSQTLDITWSPPVSSFIPQIVATSAYQQVHLGWFDNKNVRAWTCYMFNKGDANTYGCSELFGGHVGKAVVSRGKIIFSVNDWMDSFDQLLPGAVIEAANTVASSAGATPPAGLSKVPQFIAKIGSGQVAIIGDCTSPTAHQVFSTNLFTNGFLVFNGGAGATLQGVFSVVGGNQASVAPWNLFQLTSPLPWPPTPDVDTFYVSAAWPYNQSDGSYYGFPFVPDPESAF